MQWVVYWVYPHRHHQTHMSNVFQLNIIIASLLLRDRNFSAASQPHGTTLLHVIHYCSKGNFALLPKSLWLESTLESAFLKKEVWSPANRQYESHMGATWVWWVHEWILGGRMLELGLCCVLSQRQMNKYSSISLGLILGSQPQWLWLYTMETGTFCRIFSKCLLPSKAVDVYGTICYSYIQQAFWHGNLFLLKPNSLVARDTLHFASDVCLEKQCPL